MVFSFEPFQPQALFEFKVFQIISLCVKSVQQLWSPERNALSLFPATFPFCFQAVKTLSPLSLLPTAAKWPGLEQTRSQFTADAKVDSNLELFLSPPDQSCARRWGRDGIFSINSTDIWACSHVQCSSCGPEFLGFHLFQKRQSQRHQTPSPWKPRSRIKTKPFIGDFFVFVHTVVQITNNLFLFYHATHAVAQAWVQKFTPRISDVLHFWSQLFGNPDLKLISLWTMSTKANQLSADTAVIRMTWTAFSGGAKTGTFNPAN